MNGRLKLIEQQLIGIDSAAFQNLCDIYLSLREQELASINRTGSQLGKQKTVKGTPDTFFRLSDGSLRYVEYTTTADGIVAKIKGDIDKCLDPTKTGIPANEVYKIIICFNSRITVAEETDITKYAVSKNIRIELIGLDWLALEIYSKYLILAKDILGLPLDTGQLLPLQNFIEEYNNKAGKLSTPLDNQFLHRSTELNSIETDLISNDLLIISGFPGVGKTKIALESIDKFLTANKDYKAFAVSKKDIDISEDLRIHLEQDSNYILLVDDANRQLVNFKQILGIFREKRKGKIKLVITVRNYAFNDVKNECFEFEPKELVINKFTDDEIKTLISSDSFEIRNGAYQKKIIEIADGNARLAVMAARLAKLHQTNFLLGDVSDLYDSYFQTFIKDFDIFNNKSLIKTLGIVSFFFSIDRTNKVFIEKILIDFELDYHEFNEAIEELHKRELLEVQYNNARVSEQVMATYFFYKVFIKDEILPFKTLIFNYFNDWKSRFSDTIIPSNNSFGYNNVLNKINSTLTDFLNSIYANEDSVLAFFSLFWFYKREELLNYYYQKIKNFPEPQSPVYSTKYETNDFVWDKDKTIDYLSKLFAHHTESFVPALELAFEYCRKNPSSLPELIKCIRENLIFDADDEQYGFIRQRELFNLLVKKFKEGQPHYSEAFFALTKTFLAHHYQISKGGRNLTITFYQYPLPNTEIIRNFRKYIWDTIIENYESFPAEMFLIIRDFRPGMRESIIPILEFDLSILLPFIESRLNSSKFEHIHFIHELIEWLDREKLTNKNYRDLLLKFKSKEYEYFRKLDWNRLRGKQDYEFEKYEDFQVQKERDVRNSFVFKTTDDFVDFHKAIKNIASLGDNNIHSISESLNIVIEENFLLNEELGFLLLESVLNDYPRGINPLYKPVKAIVNRSESWALRLWNSIKKWEHEYRIFWSLAFFECLPEKYANEFYKAELISCIKSIDKRCYLSFESFEKFLPIKSKKFQDKFKRFVSKLPLIGNRFPFVEDNIIEYVLLLATQKIDAEIGITLSFHFFEKYSSGLAHNHKLLLKAYFQQEKLGNHFDYNREGLKTLVKINSECLSNYIQEFYSKNQNRHERNTHNNLSFVWDIEIKESQLEDIANLIIENYTYYGILEHPLIILFNHLKDDQKQKAKSFLLNYIKKYNRNSNKMNAVVDVLRHSMKEYFDEAYIYYLGLNADLEIFKKIYWRGNGGTYSGDVIIGDIHAKDWQRILSITEKAPNQLDLIPIKGYIKKQIEYELKSGEEERKRKFINPNGF